jgi:aldehyde dehydrogenase (NAD+)
MQTVQTQELTKAQAAELLARHKAFYRKGTTRNILFRKRQLKALKEAIQSHESEIFEALTADFNKPVFETLATEVSYVIGEIDHAIKHTESWARPRKLGASLLNFPAREYVQPEPFGVSLIIAPVELSVPSRICSAGSGHCCR